MKLLEYENELIKINKKAIGLVYEEKYSNHSFKAEIFKGKIACTRVYDNVPEWFVVDTKIKVGPLSRMAHDFSEFLLSKERLEWYYKKKHYAKRRF